MTTFEDYRWHARVLEEEKFSFKCTVATESRRVGWVTCYPRLTHRWPRRVRNLLRTITTTMALYGA